MKSSIHIRPVSYVQIYTTCRLILFFSDLNNAIQNIINTFLSPTPLCYAPDITEGSGFH
jgi:hypothetical protein